VRAVRGRYGSDLIVGLLEQLGIEYVALTPGATIRGLHDSLVASGRPALIECLHEEIAVAIAHGYAKAAGRPMAAALHDIVGLQHASMAVFNAWCDRVPMLLLGGTGPMDATKRRPWIDWIHTADAQASVVREYVKWDEQPASLAAVPEAVVQGLRLAEAQPQAPVYVCIDTMYQEEPWPEDLELPDVTRFPPYGQLWPEPAAVDTMAHWLVQAERPAVVADLVGRSARTFDLLVELAELLALSVVDPEGEYWKVALNFPTRHPLNLSGDGRRVLAEADVVLALELRDLHGALRLGDGIPPRIAHVSVAHLLTRSWASDHQRLQPVDLHVAAELAPTLEALLARVRELLGVGDRDRIERRRERIAAQSEALFAGWDAEARSVPEEGAIPDAYLARVVDEATREESRVLANGHLRNWVHRLWSLERPDQYLGGQGGGGLGYGLGASIGAALAHRASDRLVIDLQADGDALFTPSALWTAAHYSLPLLVVVENNRAYNNSVNHALRVARQRDRPDASASVGTMIDEPAIDFAAVARAFGVYGEGPVVAAEELRPALARALSVIREERRPALVDVVTRLEPAP
jgi:thiamine pyrophosphate-dependent acetolactate synthase large subunit-like protein